MPLPGPLAALAALSLSGAVRVADTAMPGAASDVALIRAANGTIYAAWQSNDPALIATRPHYLVAASSDGGASFALLPAQPGAALGLAAGPGDALDALLSGWPLRHRRSLDRGVSWTAPAELPARFDFAVSSSAIATAPGGEIAVVATAGRAVFLSGSPDGGSTWSTELDLALRPAGTTCEDPTLAWLDATTLLACWTERRGSTASALACARSTDAGTSFAAPFDVDLRTHISGERIFHDLAVLPPATALLAWGAPEGLFAAVSFDAAESYTAAVTLDARRVSRPDATLAMSGEMFVAAAAFAATGQLETDLLLGSSDGIAWMSAALPPGYPACRPYISSPRVLAGGASELLLADRATLFRSTDGAASWLEPLRLVPSQEPVADLVVRDLRAGRLVALWLEPEGEAQALRASVSDDAGRSWSAAVRVNDIPAASFGDSARHPDWEPEAPIVDATATAAGGLVVTWIAGAGAGCHELRASASPDGADYAPSVPLGGIARVPQSIAEDAAGRLVAAWHDGASIMSASSADGALTWSPPAVVESGPPRGGVRSSRAVALPGGSIALATVFDEADFSTPDRVSLWKTLDGGQSWSRTTVATAIAKRPALTLAGPRLVLTYAVTSCGFPCETGWSDLESYDEGASFTPFGGSFPVLIADSRMAGDAAGNVYQSNAGGSLIVSRPGQPGVGIVGELPPGVRYGRAPSLHVRAPDDVALLWADWVSTPPPGVFYTTMPADPPRILGSNGPGSICEDDVVGLSVLVAADPDNVLQWYRDGIALPGETGPFLSFVATLGSAGLHTLVATNTCGSKGESLMVWVQPKARVIVPPASASICAGATATLAVVGSPGTTSYVWYKDGAAIPGAFAPTHVIPAMTPADAGSYESEVVNACGGERSTPARLDLLPLPGAVGGTLLAVRQGGDARLTWSDVPAASGYTLWSDAARDGSFATAEGSAASGAVGFALSRPAAPLLYVRVAGTNACGAGPR